MGVSSADLGGVTWKNLDLGDEKINARGEKKKKTVHPTASSSSATQPLKLHWCCVYNNHKKRDLGRAWEEWQDGGMTRWRNEGSGSGSGGAAECVSWFFWSSFCLCPSWSPVFLWSHAALCIIPQLWVTGRGVKARQKGQSSSQAICLSFLCLFSLIPPESCVMCWCCSPGHDPICISPSPGLRYLHAWDIT